MTAHEPVADGSGVEAAVPDGAEPDGTASTEPDGTASTEPDGTEPGAPAAPVDPEQPAPLVIRRRGRRVSTEPAPGYIGEPAREQQQSAENDQRLKGDVPPHWG